MTKKKYFIFDFDSTFVKVEALDKLAEICLKNDPQKEKKIEAIKRLTQLGMLGKIPFDESLKRRLKLLRITKQDINQLSLKLKKEVSNSIKTNKYFFKKYRRQIYIISGGFKEYIIPLVKKYHILKNHVCANTFKFNKKGKVIGYDKKNPLSQNEGKIKSVKSLNLKGEIHIIGDGYTDYQIKEAGLAKSFTAFVENVKRESVVDKADHLASSLDEFLFINKLPKSISYPKNRIKVLLLENIENTAVKKFEDEGYQVEYFQNTLSQDQLIEKLAGVKILGIRSATQISKEVLKKNPKILVIGAFCIGTNQIDLKTANNLGIAVFNAPYGNIRSVVELVLGEIIILSRNIITKNFQMHQGIWYKSSVNSNEIRGKTLGIIGYGNIGSQLSLSAEALGMNVIFFDKVEKLALGNAKRCRNLAELLRKSDIISVHVDGQPDNRNLIGKKEFNLIKPNTIFINSSRGFVVDLNELAKNIKSGKIKGCAIDVFPDEPKNNHERFANVLQNLPNVILTPHIAGSTTEAQKNIAVFVSEKIIDFVNTGNTSLSVNLPQLQAPFLKKSHRLLHLHQNETSFYRKINSLFAKYNVKVLQQHHKAVEEIGYTITDIKNENNKKIIDALRLMPETIRLRILY